MDEIDHLDFPADLVDITASVCAAVERIGVEMSERLECDLSEKDSVAVESAVRKAIYAGLDIAHTAIRAYLFSSEKKIEIGPPFPFREVDVWAERYGDDAED
jgi:hypothetical protein